MSPTPPRAEQRPHEIPSPCGSRTDEYYWLRDDTREDPAVLAYLEAENAYTRAMLEPLAGLREELREELRSRLVPDESTVPYRDRGHWYWTRYEPGAEYPLHLRRADEEGAEEEVLLDVGALGEGLDFYQVGVRRISPDTRRLAYSEDRVGRRQYTLRFKDLSTAELLPDAVPGTTGTVEWLDDETVVYVERDPVTLLGSRVRRHRLGTDPADDPLLHEEEDRSFYLTLSTSSDHRHVVLTLFSTTSDEVRFLAKGGPGERFELLAPRAEDIKARADHLGDRWVIRTNWDALDFRMMEVEDGATGDRARWRELVPAREGVFVQDFALFDEYLVLAERAGGGTRLRARPWGGGEDRLVTPSEEAGVLWLSTNAEAGTRWLRFEESSLISPRLVAEVDMATKESRVLKQYRVGGAFEPEDYETSRTWIEARDGTRVPVTLAARRDTPSDGTAPLYLYGYGAYGSVVAPRFWPRMLSLMDRGVRFAVAHVRGGQEMGRAWYLEGRQLAKRNSFTDLIDVAEGLAERGLADRARIALCGGSAGGLLVGAAVNMRPDLFRVVAAHVPFVDVVTTMLDESIPLTTNEYSEWGDPRKPEFYELMLSYSPYDNVEDKDYPAMFVTGGLWDSQVQYFEPAKWVARLRARKTDENPLLLHMEMTAGHGGASGRYARLEVDAMEFAFVLDRLGATTRVAPAESEPEDGDVGVGGRRAAGGSA